MKPRRLGVELMENRLMLSATLPQPQLGSVARVQFDFSTVQVASTSGPDTTADATADGVYIDGGYIDGVVLNSMPDSPKTFGTLSGLSTDSIDVTRLSNTQPPLQQDFGSHPAGWGFGVSDLQPTVIVFQPEGTDLAPNIAPIVIGPPAGSGGIVEGGPIPIGNVLAGTPTNQPATTVKTPPLQFTSIATTERTVSPRLASKNESTISGEWARAMVFEIAGGEPHATGSPATGGQQQTPAPDDAGTQADDPLSKSDPTRENDKLTAHPQNAGRIIASPRSIQIGQNETTQADRAIRATGAVNDLSRDGLPSITDESPTRTWPQNATSTDRDVPLDDSAAAASFDRVLEGTAALDRGWSGDWRWLRLAGAAPLLMVLATERLAVLNSRRSARFTSRRCDVKQKAST